MLEYLFSIQLKVKKDAKRQHQLYDCCPVNVTFLLQSVAKITEHCFV